MSHLALYLFGPPYIERDGEVVTADTRKAVALIAYLAMTRQRHSRDALATLLWPDYDQPHARATLRRTLSALNKVLAGEWLSIDRETVGLNQQTHLWFDVAEFRSNLAECRMHNHPTAEVCASCLLPLTRATELYRDDFMAGFSLHDSANFDDWQFFHADSLRRDLTSALERLVQYHSAQTDFEAALGYARRWLSLDRLHEPVHCHMMQLYAWSGQRAAAIHQYQQCRQILKTELGVIPLEATTKLYEAIRTNHVPPPPPRTVQNRYVAAISSTGLARLPSIHSPASVGTTAAKMPAHYPLVGRTHELTTLLQIYAEIDIHGRIVILEGEAGIGKSRLAEEFLEHMQGRGTTLITARCYEGETDLAYGPVVAGLRHVLAQQQSTRWLEQVPAHWLSEAARLLPELYTLFPGLPAAPPLDSPGAQSRFFEGLRQLVSAISRDIHGRPFDQMHPTNQEAEAVPTTFQGMPKGILFFDDIHWADSASLDLLSYLVRRLRDQPTYLLLTWRSTSSAHPQRLQQLLSEAQRTGLATVLTLGRLDQPAVRKLVERVAPKGAEAHRALIQRLYQETEGLPFFLTEYLTAMTNGVLATDDDTWSLPGGVRDLLHSRLSVISQTSWQLLSTAAIIGRSFDFDTLREASGRSEEEAVKALEELISQGLVIETGGRPMIIAKNMLAGSVSVRERTLMYDFSHEKLRSVVYEETNQARRRLLHRRVAAVLVNRLRRQKGTHALAGQIAYHYQQADNPELAAEYYLQAGEHAHTLYAHSEALAHFRAALALGHPKSAQLQEAIGDMHTFLGEYTHALKCYKKAAQLQTGQALAEVEHKLGRLYERRGERGLADQHYEAALRTLGEHGPTHMQARIYADWSLSAHHRGHLKHAQKLAQTALELAETANDGYALATAHNMLGILAHSRKNHEQAYYHLEHSLALTESFNNPGPRVAALNNLALLCRAAGDMERAISLAEAALALCIPHGDRHREAALHSNLADMLHDAGRDKDSMTHLKQAVSIYAEIGVEAGAIQPEIWKLAEW